MLQRMQVFLRTCAQIRQKHVVQGSKVAYATSTASHEKKLDNRVAIITGGASGIGAATAKLFIQHGAKVIVADVQDDLGSKRCRDLGPNADYVHCDVSREEHVSACVNLAISKYKQLDVMFNNAAVAGSSMSDRVASISEVTLAEYERIMGINARGVFLGVKHAARVMIPRKKGSILSTSSMAVAAAQGSSHAYTISKHAVVGVTKTAASELARHGIRVNCISPSFTATSLALEALKLVQPSLTMEGVEHLTAVNSFLAGVQLTVEDIARAALFLGCDDGKFISAQNLLVDGGFCTSRPIDVFKNPHEETRPY